MMFTVIGIGNAMDAGKAGNNATVGAQKGKCVLVQFMLLQRLEDFDYTFRIATRKRQNANIVGPVFPKYSAV